MHQRLPTLKAADRDRLGQRRTGGGGENRVVDGQVEAQFGEAVAEGGD